MRTGPFLQRATTVISAEYRNSPVPLDVTMAPEVPADFTGAWTIIPGHGWASLYSVNFNATVPTSHGNASNHLYIVDSPDLFNDWASQWYRAAPLSDFVRGCPGLCGVTVKAPAMAVESCTSRNVSLDFYAAIDTHGRTSGAVAAPLSHDAFIVDGNILLEDDKEKINLITAYADVHDCAGTLNLTACTMASAVGEYDILVHNNTISFDAIGRPKILHLADNVRINHHSDKSSGYAKHNSTLAGVMSVFLFEWMSGLTYVPLAGTLQETIVGSEIFENYAYFGKDQQCPSTLDPWEDVVQSLNSLMFYTGVAAVTVHGNDHSYFESHLDLGLVVNTAVTGYRYGTHNIYHTDLFWFLAAALIEGLCIALILPTYMGTYTTLKAFSVSHWWYHLRYF